MGREEKTPRYLGGASIPQHDNEGIETPPCHPDASIPQHRAVSKDPEHFDNAQYRLRRGEREQQPSQPIEFIKESGDEDATYYRACDETAELLAAFYSDGRVRLADAQHRFAGMLQSGHADLLELDNNQWSELFVHTTPAGSIQLELRGGPYDARVLTCETLPS